MKRLCGILLSGLVASLPAALSTSAARADVIFVTVLNGTVGEYDATTGATVNAALITGLNGPEGIAVSGSDLFVVTSGSNTIGKYTTAGATVNAALITGLSNPQTIAVSGSDLFVTNAPAGMAGGGTIGKYTTAGATVNPALVTGLIEPIGIAVSGSDLFVGNNFGQIGEYDATTGATVNPALITGLSNPQGIAVSGSDLFVANFNDDISTIGKYTTAGATVNAALITGLMGPEGIAVSGSDLFVVSAGGKTIGVYDATTGATVNPALVTFPGGLNTPGFIAIGAAPVAAPEPSTLTLLGTGLAVLAWRRRKRTR